MMVRSVNKNDFDRRFSKSLCRSQTTETAADDHYPRCLRLLLIRAIDRIEISIVHLSLSQAFEVRNLRESWIFSPARCSGQRYVFSAKGAASMPAWGSAPGSLMDCERALKARLIDLGFGMNRAFSAGGFVIITGPGAAAPG